VTFAHNVLPALVFGGLGIASVVWTVRLWWQWRRDGAITGVGFGWGPFGSWQPVASLFGEVVRSDGDDREVRRVTSVGAVYFWLLTYALIAIALLAGALQYLRTGHGFGS
jgi:hypothetical protein